MKFKADAETFRLVSEAWRIKFTWQFEPYSAIHYPDRFAESKPLENLDVSNIMRRLVNLQQIKLNETRNFLDAEDLDELEDFPNNTEDKLAKCVTSARTLLELRQEIQTLKQLTALAKKVFYSGEDKKWCKLSELLQTNGHFARREKLIIFTEHRDTLDYLRQQISSLFGRKEVVVTIHSGLRQSA